MTTTFDFQNLTEKEIAVLLDTVLEVIENPDTPISTLQAILEKAAAKNIIYPIKLKIEEAVHIAMKKRNKAKIYDVDQVCHHAKVFDVAKVYGNAQIYYSFPKDRLMSIKTVRQLAKMTRIPLERLLVQLKEAGLRATKAEDEITEEEKTKLLAHLRQRHDKATSKDKLPIISIKKSSQQSTGFKIPPPPEPLQFNATNIASIKAESKKVSAMLNDIYEQNETILVAANAEKSVSKTTKSVLNLDDVHFGIVKVLATRPEWERDELQTLMKGMMIDGVLEHINDAFFDYCDEAFIEGDNPIEINIELYKDIFK